MFFVVAAQRGFLIRMTLMAAQREFLRIKKCVVAAQRDFLEFEQALRPLGADFRNPKQEYDHEADPL